MRGVHLAAAELGGRGYLVSQTARNARGADLLVSDLALQRPFTVQLKTNDGNYNYWHVDDPAKQIVSPTHFYVFCNILKSGPEFWIVPSAIVKQGTVKKTSPNAIFHYYCRDAAFHNLWASLP